ncbi:MAG: hypothetical protein JXR37_33040 [Kiritimatiellae bacterium]|nr:hypothetical protein [Kiritimatiellia bacterium]
MKRAAPIAGAVLIVLIAAVLKTRGIALGRWTIEAVAIGGSAFLVIEGACRIARHPEAIARRLLRMVIGTAMLTFHLCRFFTV